jgi:hypothetical protein
MPGPVLFPAPRLPQPAGHTLILSASICVHLQSAFPSRFVRRENSEFFRKFGILQTSRRVLLRMGTQRTLPDGAVPAVREIRDRLHQSHLLRSAFIRLYPCSPAFRVPLEIRAAGEFRIFPKIRNSADFPQGVVTYGNTKDRSRWNGPCCPGNPQRFSSIPPASISVNQRSNPTSSSLSLISSGRSVPRRIFAPSFRTNSTARPPGAMLYSHPPGIDLMPQK